MFTYSHTASNTGNVYDRATVDERGSWGDFKQSQADMALNDGMVIFEDVSATEFILMSSNGGTYVYKYIKGDFDKAPLPTRHPAEPQRLSAVEYKEVERLDWDSYGMKMAETTALRADCTRRKVGAVLMGADHSIISVGYNGGPSKGPSCLKGECPRGLLSSEELASDSAYDTGGGTCVALHAEWNVLLRTSWYQFEGSTLYVTCEPCHICKVLIAGTAIVRVVAPEYEWTK